MLLLSEMESSSARPVGIGFFGRQSSWYNDARERSPDSNAEKSFATLQPEMCTKRPRDNITAYLLPFPSSQLAFLREQESPDSIDTGNEKGNSRFHGKEISSTGLHQHGMKKKGDIPDPWKVDYSLHFVLRFLLGSPCGGALPRLASHKSKSPCGFIQVIHLKKLNILDLPED